MQATELIHLQPLEVIERIGLLFTNDETKSAVLASISLAQFILESGYGKTELAQNANNCFGMKTYLSGNNWSGSTWDRTSYYTIDTDEYDENKNRYTISANFRKYPCIEDSIADHSAYLTHAMNGSRLRYEGLSGEKDYKRAIQIIKDGGYATDPLYVDKICNIIERYDLTRFNAKTVVSVKPSKNKKAKKKK